MSNSKNQAAESTTAAGATSADDWRAFTSAFMAATPQARRMVCHLIQAHAAGDRRRPLEWLYHWAAFIACNPRAAYRITPALRRVVHGVVIGVCLAIVLTALTGCGDGAGGGSSSAAALRAQFGAGSGAQIVDATPTPPAQISPTETPDMQPAQIEAPAQVVEVTRIVEVAQPAQVIEVTREIVQVQLVEVTPQPMQPAQIDCAALALTPMPTIALDATDIAAGVVLRGQWQPCVSQTVTAQGVQP